MRSGSRRKRAAQQACSTTASGFELRTRPRDLAREQFGFICRRTDGRRREPVQGRATTHRTIIEKHEECSNSVALPSPRLQLLTHDLVPCGVQLGLPTHGRTAPRTRARVKRGRATN